MAEYREPKEEEKGAPF